MTTTELIALLKENEFGASGRPRKISFRTKDAFMAEPKIMASSTGDGICGPEITLYLEPKRIYREIRSNGDKIRAMTDEHLAGAIDCPLPREKCPKSKCPDCCCYTCKLNWLQQEVQDD